MGSVRVRVRESVGVIIWVLLLVRIVVGVGWVGLTLEEG